MIAQGVSLSLFIHFAKWALISADLSILVLNVLHIMHSDANVCKHMVGLQTCPVWSKNIVPFNTSIKCTLGSDGYNGTYCHMGCHKVCEIALF